jgi:hypothetical protein
MGHANPPTRARTDLAPAPSSAYSSIMDLSRASLLAAAILLGTLVTGGCRKKDAAQAGGAPGIEDTAATAIAAPAPPSTEVAVKASGDVSAGDPGPALPEAPAPPTPKVEAQGAPPSADHFWISGHWQWSGRSYVWVPGRWGVRVAPHEPPAVRIESPGLPPSRSHFWVAGHWYWTGGEWGWRGGHWEFSHGPRTWVPGRWDRRHGRWHWVEGRWR